MLRSADRRAPRHRSGVRTSPLQRGTGEQWTPRAGGRVAVYTQVSRQIDNILKGSVLLVVLFNLLFHGQCPSPIRFALAHPQNNTSARGFGGLQLRVRFLKTPPAGLQRHTKNDHCFMYSVCLTQLGEEGEPSYGAYATYYVAVNKWST